MMKSIQQVTQEICDEFEGDGLRPEEVIFRGDGKILIDRRSTDPRAVPFVLGE